MMDPVMQDLQQAAMPATPAAPIDPSDPEGQRKKVALALQLQRGMNKHPWAQMANTGLQIWNQNRTLPRPQAPVAPAMMDPTAPLPGGGYDSGA